MIRGDYEEEEYEQRIAGDGVQISRRQDGESSG